MTTRILAVAITAAITAGCAVDAGVYGGYLTAAECLDDRRCRREWKAEKREVRAERQHAYRRQHVHTAGWERRRDPRRDTGPVCQNRLVVATGEKALSYENAEIFALRSWKSEVAFEFGEQYLDFHKARNPQRTCSPVGIADTFSGKIKEKWLGVTHWRCRISAYPCKARPETVERDE